MATLVLGSGIVGTAAAWDLVRRGHDVTIADVDVDSAGSAALASGAGAKQIDAEDTASLLGELDRFEIVVSAVPYRFGLSVATAALTAGTHYLDFGGNPTVVASQMHLHDRAVDAGVMLVPDCGLAPGLANVLGEELIESSSDGIIDSIQIRVGALPQKQAGILGYQLAFNLPSEYREDSRSETISYHLIGNIHDDMDLPELDKWK